jgi:alpha/beta superfamily hydrolase
MAGTPDAEIVEERVRFRADGLLLDGVLAYPAEGEPARAVLLLAPHPHFGGRMDNNLVRHLARRAAEEGAASLRFDWRGVGASEIALPPGRSRFDHFEALERERRYDELLPDAEAAFTTLLATAGAPGERVVIGYSLGAILAALLVARAPATHVVAVSPPVARVPLDAFRAVRVPKLVLAGDADFAFDAVRFHAEAALFPPPCRFALLPGADHFHRQEEERVHVAIRDWLAGTGTAA